MNTSTRHHRLALLPALLILLAACSITSKPAGVSFQNSPDLLTNPAAGLSGLQSYRVIFQQDVVGTLDGAPFERHTSLELTRLGAQVDFVREIRGTQEDSFFHAIQTDQAVYRWQTAGASCEGKAGTLREGEIVEPVSLLLPVLQSSRVGSETINGIAATHYHFEQGGLAISEPKPSVNGEYWLASEGGFVVKYILEAAAPSNPTGTGVEARLTYTYELSRVEDMTTLELPAGCQAVPIDLPVMPDAVNVRRGSGSVSYQTVSSAAQITDLYYQQLGVLGWTAESAEPSGNVKAPLGLGFSKGELNLSIEIEEYEAGSLDVDILIYDPNAPREVPTSAITPAPTAEVIPAGPQPTVDPAQAGLPVDVPLYPGSTGLQKFGDTVVIFNAPQSPALVAGWYRDQMKAQGWSLLQETDDNGEFVQTWQKGERITALVIRTQDGQTNVNIVWSG